jgi:hypothetical protein
MGVVDHGVRYLDLDGDGVPDAVLTIESQPMTHDDSRHLQALSIVETLETGIGIDGCPSRTRVVTKH